MASPCRVKSWWNSGGQADGAPTDTSLLLPLSRIERIDATFYKVRDLHSSFLPCCGRLFEPLCKTGLMPSDTPQASLTTPWAVCFHYQSKPDTVTQPNMSANIMTLPAWTQGAEAVAVSMLSRTTYLLHAFEPGCSTELVTQIRLHVMGWGTPLDRWGNADELLLGLGIVQYTGNSE